MGLNLRCAGALSQLAEGTPVRNVPVTLSARAGALPAHEEHEILAFRVALDHVRVLRPAGEDHGLTGLEAVANAIFRRRVCSAAKGEAVKGALLVEVHDLRDETDGELGVRRPTRCLRCARGGGGGGKRAAVSTAEYSAHAARSADTCFSNKLTHAPHPALPLLVRTPSQHRSFACQASTARIHRCVPPWRIAPGASPSAFAALSATLSASSAAATVRSKSAPSPQ